MKQQIQSFNFDNYIIVSEVNLMEFENFDPEEFIPHSEQLLTFKDVDFKEFSMQTKTWRKASSMLSLFIQPHV